MRKLSNDAFMRTIALVCVLSLAAILASACGTNVPTSETSPISTPNIIDTTTNAPLSTYDPPTLSPPLPLSDFPILGNMYNPPDPGEPANEFWADAYELRPNIMLVKAGTTVTWVNMDNKPFFITAVDSSFFGITSPLGLSWSYTFPSPGTFAFTVSPYNATEIGVVVVTA